MDVTVENLVHSCLGCADSEELDVHFLGQFVQLVRRRCLFQSSFSSSVVFENAILSMFSKEARVVSEIWIKNKELAVVHPPSLPPYP